LKVFEKLVAAVREEGSAALVTVVSAEGSAPRDAGARMVVRPSAAFHGTIGGGALEFEAIARAQAALAGGRGPAIREAFLLGPQLGQCCGGRVDLAIETFGPPDLPAIAALAEAEAAGPFAARARLDDDGRLAREIASGASEGGGRLETFGEEATPVLLFGAGHVGRALALALAPLPFRVRWIDSRPDAFPRFVAGNVALAPNADPPSEIDAAEAGALVVVMTHSHPLDLAIVMRALAAEKFRYVGLIGSATKRARFVGQMRAAALSEAALARLTCPIGVPGVEGKAPAVIAASVAVQLLQASQSIPAARA
jgi:xanthine dehydrogenase accessory factor